MPVNDFTPTKSYLHKIFVYKSGNLYWNINISPKARIGKKAGSVRKDGYFQLGLNKKCFSLHRLIFLYHYGYLPIEVDHIDNNPSNNFIENLRAATSLENKNNQKLRKNNISGVKNVTWDKRRKKWCVRIALNKKLRNFGRFDSLELAELVAIEARDKYHGKFANHG